MLIPITEDKQVGSHLAITAILVLKIANLCGSTAKELLHRPRLLSSGCCIKREINYISWKLLIQTKMRKLLKDIIKTCIITQQP